MRELTSRGSSAAWPLAALALAAFGIGTTEFVIMGLLPDISQDLHVSIPKAGMLVTGYALAVAIGAPIMALLTSNLKRKTALVGLMGIFIAGNAMCAVARDYNLLMVARVVTALCHGAFFGLGAVEAASLVPENRKASAVAMMFTGLTLANVMGVPMGTAFGHASGWQSPFWVVAGIGVLTFVALILFLPYQEELQKVNMKQEVRALADGRIWIALSMTVLFAAAMFTTFTYIAPLLEDITGLSPKGVTWTLLLIGLGLTVGNIAGGRLADWKLIRALIGLFAATTFVQIMISMVSHHVVATEAMLFLWGFVTFAAVPGLQVNVVNVGRSAPNLISTLNIGAFNVGNALGAGLGGLVINGGHSVSTVPLAAAVLSALAIGMTNWSARKRADLV